MFKAVIDTNILISSLFGGKTRQIMENWRDGNVILCLSEEIETEYLKVLDRFADPKPKIEELLTMLYERTNVLFVTPNLLIEEINDDPDDNKFWECALAAKADFIISGDKHLLDLASFRDIPIVEPARFLELYKSER